MQLIDIRYLRSHASSLSVRFSMRSLNRSMYQNNRIPGIERKESKMGKQNRVKVLRASTSASNEASVALSSFGSISAAGFPLQVELSANCESSEMRVCGHIHTLSPSLSDTHNFQFKMKEFAFKIYLDPNSTNDPPSILHPLHEKSSAMPSIAYIM